LACVLTELVNVGHLVLMFRAACCGSGAAGEAARQPPGHAGGLLHGLPGHLLLPQGARQAAARTRDASERLSSYWHWAAAGRRFYSGTCACTDEACDRASYSTSAGGEECSYCQ
jgi:hypothetical protein